MDKLTLLKNKLNEFMNRSDEINEEELRQVVIFMLEIGNKHIDKAIEINETNVNNNEKLLDYTGYLEELLGIAATFIEMKSLDKEFQFYLKGFDAQ